MQRVKIPCKYMIANMFNQHAFPRTVCSSHGQGFLDDPDAFTGDERSLAVETEYPGCQVIPFSRLEIDQTGVENGDINYFSTSLFVSGKLTINRKPSYY